MLNPRNTGLLLAVLAAALVVPQAAHGVCTQGAQPTPAPMLYPGEVGLYPGCCPGPCMCVPNISEWGFYRRHWSQWPGEENRADITRPMTRGIEVLKTPVGAQPPQLPREEYAPLPTETQTPGLQIGEGAGTGPVEPPAPFDFGPDFQGTLPGLDATPSEGPLPGGTPESKEKKLQQPGLMETPGTDLVPPAPLPNQSGALPSVTKPVLVGDGPTPTAPVAEPVAPSLPAETVAARPTSGLPAVGPVQSTVLTDGKTPAARPSAEMAPLPEEIATWGQKTLLPKAQTAATAAPLPEAELPWLPETAAPEQAAWPEARRERADRPATRPVDFQEPIEDRPADRAGLEGYCPVELVRNERWVRGNPQLAVEHQGQTYWLSGPAQHRLFRAKPDVYAPVLSGFDPVLAATGEGKVAGRTEACVIYGGRLFMFSSRATLARFQESPKQFLEELERSAR